MTKKNPPSRFCKNLLGDSSSGDAVKLFPKFGLKKFSA